jgi:hypothetical protein
MLVFHFVNEKYGLENLRKRRLKIATLQELNDPFELFGIDQSNESVRRAFQKMKVQLSENRGLLCFSRNWQNPVLWSHYAEKHRGICLGFEVPEEKLGRVSYSRKRLVAEVDKLISPHQLDVETWRRFLFTKYSHWKYEDEIRCFVTLEERDPDNNLYFAEFSEQLKLMQVIVGAESSMTRETLRKALGDLAASVVIQKARLAFRSFRVVRQKKERLWV